ncbi:Caulimovirus viroplasmin [Phytophthora infestans]|uniref:ribonuclease H n=1 Tax=Phytophthora infestans TaxID=4787 RepID=A0A833VVE7_PHYIN|nr:Caulimovirus viroplasmin [Phytophthora infestans]KAF4131266.1 Caulimovirus viroplasmin [Phytophthora infestans]
MGYDDRTWYYAVAVGRRVGIFTDYQDAVDQVHGYPNFRMKKFQYYDEAQDFIDYFNEDCDSVEDEQNPIWYYAVVVGRCTGIYTDVDQALAQTHGYSNAKMTKFLPHLRCST